MLFGSGTDPISLLILLLFLLLLLLLLLFFFFFFFFFFLLLLPIPSVVSNPIGVKFCRIVPPVNTLLYASSCNSDMTSYFQDGGYDVV